ncbi:hypothetical protein ASE02_13640 [Phenylobacterium sp. Root700]|nr:hypothetical protein ASE02_13640 [Phenylobacterium sp. Root700]
MDMRPLLLSLALLTVSAAPALAQVDHQSAMRDLDVLNQQQMQLQRSVALENQLSTLEAKVQTEQRLRDIDAIRTRPSLTLPSGPRAVGTTNADGYVSIPDDMLAASNARVRAASQNRR